jgi:hypothetical protein
LDPIILKKIEYRNNKLKPTMKKNIVTLAITLIAAITSSAQGIVLFANSGGYRVSTNTVVGGAASGTTAQSGSGTSPSFYYALFASQTTNAVGGSTNGVVGSGTYAFSDGNWTFQDNGTNGSTGRLSSSQLNAQGDTALTFAGGSTAYFTIVGWSANIGTTYQSLQSYLANPTFNGFAGESTVSGALIPGIEGSTGATPLFGAYPNIPGFTLGLVTPVPEPGTMALAALSGASLLLFRRRK